MKIRIITFQRANNYGALLQCYALYSYIKKLNFDTKVLDYRNPYIESQYSVVPESGNIKKILTYMIKYLHPSYKWQLVRKKRFELFRERIEFTDSIIKTNLKKLGIDCDLVISGSDQILNPDITDGFDDVYYLNFPCTGIKATYAASIGSLNSKLIKSKLFFDKIKAADFLSIRERDACEYISRNLNKNVHQSVDPTLLLGRKTWDNTIENIHYNIPNEYILLYYLERNQELIEAAEKLSLTRKIPVLYFNNNAKLNCSKQFCGDAGPLEFVWLIKNSSVVVTSSFHASVFSFLYEKEIYIMTHSKTGSRVASLAEMFGARKVICASIDEFIKKSETHESESGYLGSLNCIKKDSQAYIVNLIEKAERKNE